MNKITTEFYTGLNNPICRLIALAALAILLTLMGCNPQDRASVLSAIAIVSASALAAHGFKNGGSAGVSIGLGSIAHELQPSGEMEKIRQGFTEAMAAENAASSTQAAPPPPSATVSMGVVAKSIGMLLMLGAMLTGIGCKSAATGTPLAPAVNLATVTTAYTDAMDVLDLAEAVGLIDPSLDAKIQPLLAAVQAALATAQQQSASGDTNTAADAMAQVMAAIGKLQPYISQLKSGMTQKPAAAPQANTP